MTFSTAVAGLYEWRQPAAPEDLCLLRSDRSAVLVTIAHEEDAYLELEPAELKAMSEAWPEVVRVLRT